MNIAPLNPQAIAYLRKLGPNVLPIVVDDFRRSTHLLLADLREAVRDRDVEMVRLLKQALRETSDIFGATTLGELCDAKPSVVDLPTWLRKVEVEYRRVAAALAVE